MQLVPGVQVEDRDVRCAIEEIDLVLWNGQEHPFLKPWDSIILVECKNWQTAIGAPEIAWFLSKLRRRRITNGIFVASRGITGDFNRDATRLLVDALSEGIRVIVLTNEDLASIDRREALFELIKRKYCRLFLGIAA